MKASDDFRGRMFSRYPREIGHKTEPSWMQPGRWALILTYAGAALNQYHSMVVSGRVERMFKPYYALCMGRRRQ